MKCSIADQPCETPMYCMRDGCAKKAAMVVASPAQLRMLNGDEQPATCADSAPQRTAQVIRWRGITRHDLPVDRILDMAREADLGVAIVLGYEPDGTEYFASSVADGADVLWLLERLKQQLLTSGLEGG